MTQDMEYTDSQIAHMLHEAKVRPSLHRIAVLDYVANGRTHPTADEIYRKLASDYPTVSRTTVYNSLHTLTDAGLLKELEIENGCSRYDLARQRPHSHFTCRKCGQIFDMGLPEGLKSAATAGFRIDSVDLYFSGLCPNCID